MTNQEAHAQAFENGRQKGDAEGYARGKAEAFVEAGDLISVKAARETCQRIFSDPVLIHAVDTTLKNTPAVAAQPVKRGQWFRTGRENVYGGIEIQCSECGHTLMTSPGHIDEEYFCCHCGADMRGESDA